MTNPTWFNKAQYLDSKLAQLIASGDTRFSDIVALDSAIEAAGYTAYSHFQSFSLVERTSPNSYFNAAEYLEAKAAQANATKAGGKADWNSSTIALAIKDAGFATIWDHFTQFGWKEGVNPSNAFDVSSYFDAKLAQLQKAEPTANWTMATMKAAFEKAGIDPVTHALTYGAAEGVKPVTVPVAEQVSASPVSPNVGKTYALTTGVDNVVGTSGNDTVNGSVDGAAGTFSSLDAIDGGAGADTLNILQVITGAASGLVIKNVENAVIRSADNAKYDTTAWAGLTSLKLTQAGDADLTAAATTALDVSGATGKVNVNGGSTVAVAAEAGSGVVVGDTTGSAGAVSVTYAKMDNGKSGGDHAAGSVKVDGGTDVTVTAAGSTDGTVTIGGSKTVAAPTGKIAVTLSSVAVNGDTGGVGGAIKVTGGSSVTVTQSVTAGADVATKSTAALIAQGDVTVTGTSVTTSVTVNQTEANAGKTAVKAVAGVNQVDAITFIALAKAESVTVGGLKFTASKDLTAAEVAAAFSNLSAGVTQGAAPAGNGIYTGTFGAYTTGSAVTANSVTTLNATATTAGPAKEIAVADDADAAKANVAAVVKTVGVAANPAVTGALNIAGGKVTIDGQITGADVLSTVSLNGFGAGSTIKSDALSALNLSNSAQDLTVTNGAASTLALALDNVKGSAVTLGDAYTALNITTAGKSSAATLTANKVTALTVAGDQAANLTGSSFAALKTVTVTGSAGLTVDASGANVDTTATTGQVTASIDASKATYTGGAGVDQVTLTSATVSKAVSTGAGDDLVRLAAGTTTLGANVSAGEGTADTLEMAVADAVTASGATTFEAKIDGFEKLALQASAVKSSVDLANLDDISYVVNYGSTDLTLTKMANNGTLELINNSTKTTVEMTDAKAATDSFNILVNNGHPATKPATLAAGEVVVHKVETVNIVSNVATAKSDNTLTLSADAVKAVVVTGNGALNLTAADATLTSVNASALSSVFTFSSAVKGATVTGGSDNDMLTAAGNEQTLVGGAGNDTLTVTGDLATLTGGAGKDTFAIGDATSNVNSYATITDLAAGDVIKFAASASNFAAAKVKLGDTAVFQDFANNAIATTNLGDVSWFQVGGNTYAVQNVSDTTSFLNGTDVVVRITGLVDLSTASFSSEFDTLLIA